ncbi:MAG: TRL-like family protein [Leptospiraceae bacterium]|nr:TRL-like family protein [Leptospiraceae bacterium]
MKHLILVLLFSIQFCTTTLSPGLFYNSTAEHIYRDRVSTQLGSGRILKMEKSCSYNSIIFATFYHGKPSTVENVLKEGKITKVGVIDHSSFSILGSLYYSNCIIVWGETE